MAILYKCVAICFDKLYGHLQAIRKKNIKFKVTISNIITGSNLDLCLTGTKFMSIKFIKLNLKTNCH
jgi:hypothetical protein